MHGLLQQLVTHAESTFDHVTITDGPFKFGLVRQNQVDFSLAVTTAQRLVETFLQSECACSDVDTQAGVTEATKGRNWIDDEVYRNLESATTILITSAPPSSGHWVTDIAWETLKSVAAASSHHPSCNYAFASSDSDQFHDLLESISVETLSASERTRLAREALATWTTRRTSQEAGPARDRCTCGRQSDKIPNEPAGYQADVAAHFRTLALSEIGRP